MAPSSKRGVRKFRETADLVFRPFGWRAESILLLNYIPRMKPTTSPTTTSDRLTTVLSYGALLLIVPALVVLVYTTRQAVDATARLQTVLMDPEKALPAHAIDWIHHQLPKAWQGTDFSPPLRQGAERMRGVFG